MDYDPSVSGAEDVHQHCLSEDFIQRWLRRSPGLGIARKYQKHQKNRCLRLVGSNSSLVGIGEVDVLAAEPSQLGGMGEALLNHMRLLFWE